MPCFRPLTAYRTNSLNPETGKFGITLSRAKGLTDMEIELPCGKCQFCLSAKQNQWALRCEHEAMFHDENCFITLTYDDDKLPEGYKLEDGLVHKHFQDFMKRLRKAYTGKTIRYFMCGEYGAEQQRPHFHAILFGIGFSDKEYWSKQGKAINYRSKELERLWPYGYSTIGPMHFGTALYVAKYSMKRMLELGIEYGNRRPEYRKMSQGLGRDYAQKFNEEVAKQGNIVWNGRKNAVPRYYEKYMSDALLQHMKDHRIRYLRRNPKTLWQLRVMEKIATSRRQLYEQPRVSEALHNLRRKN